MGWLMLKLKIGEEVVLQDAAGTEIGRVSLGAVTGRETARLGFQFPREVQIVRAELLDDPPVSG